jgi:hypothetical protein
LCALVPAGVSAQEEENPDDEAMYLSVAPETGRLSIRIGSLFSDEALAEALHSGLPLRIHLVVDLWKDGFFDSHKGRGEWRATVVFDPMDGRYRVATGDEGSEEAAADSLPAVREALQSRFTMPVLPRERGRYYYLGKIEVETLSLSDLEELQRWLRGDLAPAAAGDEEMGGAVGRGVGRLLVRVLGLPARRFKVRTAKFEVGPPPPLEIDPVP